MLQPCWRNSSQTCREKDQRQNHTFPKCHRKYLYFIEVAFYIFTNGRQTLGLNLTERFSITDNALENMPWPDMDVYDATKMFKSKLRFQIRHGDFRQRISQDEEDIQSILNW